MNKHFKPHERELVKLATYFKKQSKKLIEAGKLSAEHQNVGEAVDRFINHLDGHANIRASVLEEREHLKKLVKDDAVCPSCNTRDMLKLVGTEKNDKGWKSNRYRCRKCNIEFTWNRPNNPWDMIAYIEEVLGVLQLKHEDQSASETEKDQLSLAIESMRGNLDKLKPVIDAHRREFDAMESREAEMEKLIHEFRNTLLIEKIKMDTWENRNV